MVEQVSIDENTVAAVVYPNPVSERLHVSAEGLTNVSVFSILGQRLLDVNLDSDECVLDVSVFENGVYMLKVSTQNGGFTRRICISK